MSFDRAAHGLHALYGSPVPLAAVHGAAAAEEKVGVVVLCLLAGIVLLARPARLPRRLAAVAMLLALVLTPVLLVVDIWGTSPMLHFRDRPALAAAAIAGGLVLVGLLALLIRRKPNAFPLLAVFALPFRLPISSAGTTANLLVPLYVVVAAGALASLLPALSRSAPPAPDTDGAQPDADRAQTDADRPQPLDAGRVQTDADRVQPPDADRVRTPREHPHPRNGVSGGVVGRLLAVDWPRLLQWLLAATLLLYSLQAAYSSDFSKALQNVVFFYVPFSLLFVLLLDVSWSKRLLLQCAGVVVVLALLFAGVGFVEYQRKALFLNPKVVAANHFDTYFRVNSVFFDPNIYGRFLALVMLIITTGVLWARRRRQAAYGALALAWLWAGLITSFSQSSMAALLIGLAVLAAYRWDALSTVYVTGAGVAIGIVILFTAPPSLHLGLTGPGGSANNATSGRASLVEGGLQLFADRPIYGFGSGSFATQYTAHQNATTASATSASHTIPITVAAEQGIVGLLLYVSLVIASLGTLFVGAGRAPPAPSPARAAGVAPPFRIAIAACFLALLLHTFAYADFLEDPVTWTLLGIGVALASAARRQSDLVDVEGMRLASSLPSEVETVRPRG